MSNARKVLTALAGEYSFAVYGYGEVESDIITANVDAAMEHIESQDETEVHLYHMGALFPSGTINIVGEEGDFTVFDFSANYNSELWNLLDSLVRED